MTPLDINTVAQSDLMLLRGVGAVRAARIVAGRPYKAVHDLVGRNIISEGVYKKIAAQLTVSIASDHNQ